MDNLPLFLKDATKYSISSWQLENFQHPPEDCRPRACAAWTQSQVKKQLPPNIVRMNYLDWSNFLDIMQKINLIICPTKLYAF